MAAEWTVRVEAAADRELGKLPRHLKDEALDILRDFTDDPVPRNAEPMRRNNNAYRLYFGGKSYRIIYTVNRARREVRVFRIRPRRDAYKGLRNP